MSGQPVETSRDPIGRLPYRLSRTYRGELYNGKFYKSDKAVAFR